MKGGMKHDRTVDDHERNAGQQSRKSQQNSYILKMLTRRRKKSQQNGYMPKMLTRKGKKSQQNSYMP